MIVDHESQRFIASSSSISQVTDTLDTTGFFTNNPGHKSKGVYLGPASSGSSNPAKTAGSYEGRKPPSNYRGAQQKRSPVVCDFCGYNGHTREQCFKLIGYPSD